MTSYQVIYDKFLSKIEDLSLAQMNEPDRMRMLYGWFDSALGMIQAEQLSMQSDLTNRNDETASFREDLSSNEIEAIALYMVGTWYEDRVNSLEHTSMFWGSTDEKWNNPKDHLKAVSENQEKYFNRARKMFRNYNYKVGLLSKEAN